MFRNTRHIHLVAIGGVGMSGIAEVLLSLGFSVSGSDLRRSATTERLAEEVVAARLAACVQVEAEAAKLEDEAAKQAAKDACPKGPPGDDLPDPDDPDDLEARLTAFQGVEEAKRLGRDVVIVDTAGRLAIDAEMMAEIQALHGELDPIETLFVVDAMTGQDAVRSAQDFAGRLPLTGVILTKADGDARGGAALSIRQILMSQQHKRGVAVSLRKRLLPSLDQTHLADRCSSLKLMHGLGSAGQPQPGDAFNYRS